MDQDVQNSTRAGAKRLASLDLLRGLTVLGMIIVNATAAFETVMPQVFPVLLHAKWAGFTAADAVFPAFITMVGVSIAVSAKPGLPVPPKKILWRSIKLYVLGLLLFNMYLPLAPDLLWPPRITGVLQRIAIVFAVVAVIYPRTTLRTRAIAATILLLGYWGICNLPLPDGSPVDLWAKGRNFPSWFDREVMAAFLPEKGPDGFDAEGILSTIPAIAQAILGTIAGDFLRRGLPIADLSRRLALTGIASMLIGLAWSTLFPFAKPIWTSSFVMLTTGMVLLGLGLFHYAFDRSDEPMKKGGLMGSFGRNAIAAYTLHLVLIQLMMIQPMQASARFASSFVGLEWGALVPVLIFLVLIWLPMAWLDRRGKYWKI